MDSKGHKGKYTAIFVRTEIASIFRRFLLIQENEITKLSQVYFKKISVYRCYHNSLQKVPTTHLNPTLDKGGGETG